MNQNYDEIYQTLHAIYNKHWRKFRENPDSKEMCCMWSTENPPDVLEGTEPLLDMEEAFDVCLDEDTAIELFDMKLDEATNKIMQAMEKKM